LTDATDADMTELVRGLDGTPYTIEADGAATLEHVVRTRLGVFKSRAAELATKYASESLYPLRVTHRVREVYESNAIEGLGLGLPETEQTMRTAPRLSIVDLTRLSMTHSLLSDSHVYDVVGLQRARELADLIAESRTRPITETDLRDMHRMILGGARGAGEYKRYVNSISGSEHDPPPPTDVPAYMRSITAWLSKTDLHPLVQATVAHAWFTHVHPFEDGNGRMARLVTNLVLSRAGYPPIIVKASTHRHLYIEALAYSDRGGDILPLLGIFSGLLKSTFRQVERPEAALRMWRRMLQNRQPSAFLRWLDVTNSLLIALQEGLPANFSMTDIGTVDQEDYALLVSGAYYIAPRIAQITLVDDDEFELLVIATPATSRGRAATGTRGPSLRFLQRTRDTRDPKTHRELRVNSFFKYNEIVVLPENIPSALLVGGHYVLPAGTSQSAAIIVQQIADWSENYRNDPEREFKFMRPRRPQRNFIPRPARTRFQKGKW
jgi:Fic family protein